MNPDDFRIPKKKDRKGQKMGNKTKKPTRTQKKELRLQKAKQWLLTYNGTPKHMAKHYRKRFHLNLTTAIRDLREIGVEFTPEYLDAVRRSEEERIRQKRLKKEKKMEQEFLNEDCDGVFAFIAGYTEGDVPYGIIWSEHGLEPYASYDELAEAYGHRDGQQERANLWTEETDFNSICS